MFVILEGYESEYNNDDSNSNKDENMFLALTRCGQSKVCFLIIVDKYM